MMEIRDRLTAHRNDALALLEQASHTAQLYTGFRLAGAVSHLARAQVLLQEELEGLLYESKEKAASPTDEFGGAGEDATPVNGMHLKKKGPRS